MFNFFVENNSREGNCYYIEGADFNHIKNVVRMHVGDEILVSENGMSHLCEIMSLDGDTCVAEVREENYQNTDLPVEIHLFQALPKGDKMEFIIQKTVELGVDKIHPVEMKRCVVKLDDKKESKKIARWQQIAEGGAKQSGRGLIPKIKPLMRFSEALGYAKELDAVLVPYEKAEGMAKTREIIKDLKGKKSVGIFIGPEGGFDESEIEEAMASGAFPVTLGRRILRTETAGLTMLSVLMFEFEEE